MNPANEPNQKEAQKNPQNPREFPKAEQPKEKEAAFRPQGERQEEKQNPPQEEEMHKQKKSA